MNDELEALLRATDKAETSIQTARNALNAASETLSDVHIRIARLQWDDDAKRLRAALERRIADRTADLVKAALSGNCCKHGLAAGECTVCRFNE